MADPSVSGHLWPHIHSRLSSGSITVLDCSSGVSPSGTSRSGSDLLDLCDWITPRLAASCRAPLVLLVFSSCHAFLPAFWACLRSGLPALPLALPGSADEQQREARRLAATYGVAGPAASGSTEPAALLLHDEGGAAFAQAIARQALLPQSVCQQAEASPAEAGGASGCAAGTGLQLLSFSALCSAPAARPTPAAAITASPIAAGSGAIGQGARSSAADLPPDIQAPSDSQAPPGPQAPLDPQAPAYILETSGTTGTPRAACFSGASEPAELLDRAVLWLFPLSSSSGISGAFAQHRLTAFLPLAEAIRDPDRLLALIEQQRITGFAMPPVLLGALLRHLREPSGPLQRRDLSSLTRINIGSAASNPADIAALQELLAPWGLAAGVIHTGYGLTETGVLAWGAFDPAFALALPPGETLIGPLYEQVDTRFDDDGVLEVRKPFSFLGYLQQPAAGDPSTTSGSTAADPDPSAPEAACHLWELSRTHGLALEPFRSGTDWFHTGDRARLEPPDPPAAAPAERNAGPAAEAATASAPASEAQARPRLVLRGRAKDILVVNSRKHSLSAIEQALQERFQALVALVSACALPPEPATSGRSPAGYVNDQLLLVMAPGSALASHNWLGEELEQQIQALLQERFGLVAAAIRLLDGDAFPRTSTGKIRKADLVAWHRQGDGLGDAGISPRMPAPTHVSLEASAAVASHPASLQSSLPQEPSALEQQLLRWIRRHAPLHQPLQRQQKLSSFGIDSLAFAGLVGELERSHGRRCHLELCPPDPSIGELLTLFGEPAPRGALPGTAALASSRVSSQTPAAPGGSPSRQEDQPPWIADPRPPAQVMLRHSHEQLLRAANLQAAGEPVGLGGITRLHNPSASGQPLALLSAWPGQVIRDIAARLPDHPLYVLRVAHDFGNAANHQYMLFCYLEWLESCLVSQQRPFLLAGNCRAALLTLELAGLLQQRQLEPRHTLLLQWDPRLVPAPLPPALPSSGGPFYTGSVSYQVHRDHHGGDPQQAQTLIQQLRQLTPAVRQVLLSATSYNPDSVYPAGQQPYETLIQLVQQLDGAGASGHEPG